MPRKTGSASDRGTDNTRITPRLEGIMNMQAYTFEVLGHTSYDCGSQLSHISTELTSFKELHENLHEAANERASDTSDSLKSLQAELRTAQDTCMNLGQSLESQIMRALFRKDQDRNSWMQDMTEKLILRDNRVDELRESLTKTSQMVLKSFDQMHKSLATRLDAERIFRHMMNELRDIFEKQSSFSRSKAEMDLERTHGTLANLANRIGVMDDQLKDIAKYVANPVASKEQSRLAEELALSLRNKIARLEAEAKATVALRGRWQSDIEVVDAMKSKLKHVADLMHDPDNHNFGLEESSRLLSVVESCSRFMHEEHEWIQEQLQGPALCTEVITAKRDPACLSTAMLVPKGQDDMGFVDGEVLGEETQDDDGKTTRMARAEAKRDGPNDCGMKRVQVRSPAESESPFIAPSVEQEQRRRRDPSNLRPILKSSHPSPPEENDGPPAKGTETETELGPIQGHRQLSAVIRTSRITSQRIIDEISSGFITERTDDNVFDLPTAANFKIFSKPSDKHAEQKRNITAIGSEDNPEVKRVRIMDREAEDDVGLSLRL